jgi:hypothetical protein
VVVLRGGDRQTISVELAVLPSDEIASNIAPDSPEAKVETLGMEVSDMTPEIAKQLGFKEAEGAVITSVTPGSAGKGRRERWTAAAGQDHERITIRRGEVTAPGIGRQQPGCRTSRVASRADHAARYTHQPEASACRAFLGVLARIDRPR